MECQQDAVVTKRTLLSLFFAGFLLCFGISVQALGFYLCVLLLPITFHAYARHRFPSPTLAGLLGCLFLVIYAVFPITSVLAYLFTDPGTLIPGLTLPDNFQTAKLFASRFGSAMFISAATLLGLYLWDRKQSASAKTTLETVGQQMALEFFTRGLVLGLLLLVVYAAVQHFTGFDLRAAGFHMDESDLMHDGRFRALGFYGHQLSLATIALALFTYYYTHVLHLSEYFKYVQTKRTWRFFFGLSVTVCVLSLTLIFLSGSRMALGLASLIFILMPLAFAAKSGMNRKRLLLFWMGGIALLGALLFFTGAYTRMNEILVKGKYEEMLGDRLIFWRVHWAMFIDRPWLGQGYAFIDQFVREAYYKELGYASFPERFNAHNLYLEVLANAGIVGLFVITIATISGLALLYHHARRTWYTSVQYKALVVAFVANLLHGLTQNTYFDSSCLYIYLVLLWILLWNLPKET